jgi:hypothetical protein
MKAIELTDAGMTMLQKPTVLILGSTGQIGRFILESPGS